MRSEYGGFGPSSNVRAMLLLFEQAVLTWRVLAAAVPHANNPTAPASRRSSNTIALPSPRVRIVRIEYRRGCRLPQSRVRGVLCRLRARTIEANTGGQSRPLTPSAH